VVICFTKKKKKLQTSRVSSPNSISNLHISITQTSLIPLILSCNLLLNFTSLSAQIWFCLSIVEPPHAMSWSRTEFRVDADSLTTGSPSSNRLEFWVDGSLDRSPSLTHLEQLFLWLTLLESEGCGWWGRLV